MRRIGPCWSPLRCATGCCAIVHQVNGVHLAALTGVGVPFVSLRGCCAIAQFGDFVSVGVHGQCGGGGDSVAADVEVHARSFMHSVGGYQGEEYADRGCADENYAALLHLKNH